MKILVISLAGIGDTLLAMPLIRLLRQHYPSARIEALVMWAGSRELLELEPGLNEIHYCNLLRQSHLSNLKFLLRLRRQRYDLSINTYPQSRIHYRVIAGFIHAKRRLSHLHENRCWLDRWLVNDTLEQDYTIHCIDNNLNLLGQMGFPVPRHLDWELPLAHAEVLWAEEFIANKGLAGKPVLGVHVGSGKTKNLILKRWPVDHYIELLRQVLEANPELMVLLFGGPDEQADNEAILGALKTDRILPVPSRTIRQAAAVLRHCDLFLSVDNAFMHLAAAVKVPRQVVIESPTFNKTIEPYRRPFRLVHNPMVAGRNLEYYLYDGRDIQGGREHLLACMRSITPAMVFEAITQTLREPVSS